MRKTTAWLLLAALLLAVAGCVPASQEEDEGLKLWFPVDPALERVSAPMDACPYQGEEWSIPGLLAALVEGPPAEAAELTGLFPAGTRLLSWSLEDGVASVELSAAYAELVGVELTLADYCVALTLTQLPGVEGVRVTASGGGQSYRDRPALYPGGVLSSGVEEAPVELTAALYFRREGENALGAEWRSFRVTGGETPVKAVLAALIAGPEEQGLLPLLPPDLTVRSAWVEDGLCCADLSGQLLDLPEEERALALKSIVDTLCSLDTVERVQILVEGEPVEEFGGVGLSGLPPDPAAADG